MSDASDPVSDFSDIINQRIDNKDIFAAVFALFNLEPERDKRRSEQINPPLQGNLYSQIFRALLVKLGPEERARPFRDAFGTMLPEPAQPPVALLFAPLSTQAVSTFTTAIGTFPDKLALTVATTFLAGLRFELGARSGVVPDIPEWKTSVEVITIRYGVSFAHFYQDNAARNRVRADWDAARADVAQQVEELRRRVVEATDRLNFSTSSTTAEIEEATANIERLKENSRMAIEDTQKSALAELEKMRLAWVSETDEGKKEIVSAQGSARVAIAEIEQGVRGIRTKLDVVGKRIETAEEELRAVGEKYNLREARQLWGKRAKEDSFAFWGSLIIAAIAMIGLPVLSFVYSEELLNYIVQAEKQLLAGTGTTGDLAQTVATVGRIALVSAPFLLIVWLIRFVMRFNLRSMLLMDDARQRVTMLDTYLFLVGQDAAVKEERKAILDALFRRPPGHGTDPVEPTSIVNEIFGQDGAKKAGGT